MSLAQEFLDLFKGSDIAHGTFVVGNSRATDGKKQGTAKVLREPTTVTLWEEHLKGGTGLGIIPINSENTCRWGAIDIDEYDVSHPQLVELLRENKIPAVVGRTKSGGAHVWIFLSDAIEAEQMQRKMTELSAALGHAGCEIFPKQSTILVDRGDTGNFLNMPYHSGSKSTRYAYNDKGEALTPEEFIAYAKQFVLTPAKFRKLNMSFATKEGVLEEGPPCLQHLCSKGFGEGSRNNALFNLGVYARLYDEDNWETLLQRYNMDYLHPPLSHNEVGTVIRQLKKKDYFYKCEDQPIKPFCDKEVCKLRKYGVGPAGISNDLSSLTKINGDPPIWILNVDGSRVELSTSALTSQAHFQKECVSQINKFPISVNQRAWQTRIQMLLDSLTIVEVPPDATIKGEFEDLLHAFAADRAKGEEREDILQGVAVWLDERVWFQVKDLKKHLHVNDFNHYTSNKITLRLQDLQAEKMFWRVRGKGVHVWSLAQDFFSDYEEEIPLPDLPKDGII
ncbi:MAG: hypothetical protein Unbinned4834contig1000_16 [Prokaryotic dsDNA virus sp.]|nr:MAG: hypothetical protein Unbinned4834contig1000_16 [Prokaryotic dsDNA virus sp.]|tara:strand:- start:41087 stop:42607 length:1521 start_codon:yes stop_codon:yes gene_type:complete